jgi:hypothetical protein
MAQLSNLLFFDTDSSFWVYVYSATGLICKDKSLFTEDLLPSIFKVGSGTGTLTPTLMGTVTLQLTNDEGVFHSFDLNNVNHLYCFGNLQNCIQMHLIIQIGMPQAYDESSVTMFFFGIITSSKRLL